MHQSLAPSARYGSALPAFPTYPNPVPQRHTPAGRRLSPSPFGRRLRVVREHEAEPVTLVAIGMQVAAHRLAGTFHGLGAHDVRIDDPVVMRRTADIHAPVAGSKRAIRQRGGRMRDITERRADAEHPGRAAVVAFPL